jgi:N utilization substance protein B
LAREIALRSLFQADAGHNDIDEAVRYNASELAAGESSANYARKLVSEVMAHQIEIDAVIKKRAFDWAFERLVGTDRAILRVALCELQYMGDDVPAGVVINEAVELAKLYGGEDSGRFVNGVLGNVIRDMAQNPGLQ